MSLFDFRFQFNQDGYIYNDFTKKIHKKLRISLFDFRFRLNHTGYAYNDFTKIKSQKITNKFV